MHDSVSVAPSVRPSVNPLPGRIFVPTGTWFCFYLDTFILRIIVFTPKGSGSDKLMISHDLSMTSQDDFMGSFAISSEVKTVPTCNTLFEPDLRG